MTAQLNACLVDQNALELLQNDKALSDLINGLHNYTTDGLLKTIIDHPKLYQHLKQHQEAFQPGVLKELLQNEKFYESLTILRTYIKACVFDRLLTSPGFNQGRHAEKLQKTLIKISQDLQEDKWKYLYEKRNKQEGGEFGYLIRNRKIYIRYVKVGQGGFRKIADLIHLNTLTDENVNISVKSKKQQDSKLISNQTNTNSINSN